MDDLDRDARAQVYARMTPLLLGGLDLAGALTLIGDEATQVAASHPGTAEGMLALRVSSLAEFLRGGEFGELPPLRLVPTHPEEG